MQPSQVFAAGDWLNDLPMLDRRFAHFLAAPWNAVEPVKEAVRSQRGFVSRHSHGEGVADALEFACQRASREYQRLSLPAVE